MMYPEFYIHCLMQDEDLDLLFCHRWLVLCFKREFIEFEVLNLWEACWSRYQTDYFHIFICVAIIRLYGNRCIEAKMRVDEMMQYFMDMATQFDGSAVLREARSLLYRFRKFQVIPCTLQGFLSGPGVWDGGIEPEIECVSRHRRCCFIDDSLSGKECDDATNKESGLTIGGSSGAEEPASCGDEKEAECNSSDEVNDNAGSVADGNSGVQLTNDVENEVKKEETLCHDKDSIEMNVNLDAVEEKEQGHDEIESSQNSKS